MKQEDKELLLKDLCARLPYGVMVNYGGYKGCDYVLSIETLSDFPFYDLKPYLFPLSSMTEEQNEEWRSIRWSKLPWDELTWLNKNHFDYRHLIEKGLAIDATGLNIY